MIEIMIIMSRPGAYTYSLHIYIYIFKNNEKK